MFYLDKLRSHEPRGGKYLDRPEISIMHAPRMACSSAFLKWRDHVNLHPHTNVRGWGGGELFLARILFARVVRKLHHELVLLDCSNDVACSTGVAVPSTCGGTCGGASPCMFILASMHVRPLLCVDGSQSDANYSILSIGDDFPMRGSSNPSNTSMQWWS